MNFQAILDSGKCTVRQIMPNNNRPGQVTVIFQQKVSRASIPAEFFNSDSVASNNPLVALAQGTGGEFIFTAPFSFAEDKIVEAFDTNEIYFYDADVDTAYTAKEFFQLVSGQAIDVTIKAVRSTAVNPYRSTNTPVQNPRTGEKMTFEGRPLYMHTTIVPGTDVVAEFAGHELPEFLQPRKTVDSTADVVVGEDEEIF